MSADFMTMNSVLQHDVYLIYLWYATGGHCQKISTHPADGIFKVKVTQIC